LGLWTGTYRRKRRQWLRWYDADGNWVLTEEELERQQRQQAEAHAEQAEARAEQAEAHAALLAEQLRQLGINPDELT
jgi:hypothetical protein